jgi:small-conductance mechanosensitive channel
MVLSSTLNAIIWVLAIAMVLGEFGFNLGPIIASAGVIGVALGLGAQTLVRDILSGIFMLIEDQYGVGDKVDVLEVKGTVEKVGLRITTVRDENGTLWYLRNGEILKVGNLSQSG